MTASSPPLSEDEVLSLLTGVVEPCSLLMGNRTDIVEMGLVETIAIAEGHVSVELVLTDTSCVHYARMHHYIRDVLMGHPAVHGVEVTVSTTILWTPDRRGRKSLQPAGD